MKFKINAILIAALAIIAPIQAQAQKETTHALEWSILHGLEYEIYAGVNIGGTAPIPSTLGNQKNQRIQSYAEPRHRRQCHKMD